MEKQASSPLQLVTDPLKGREGTVFDKPAPTAPPLGSTPERGIPPHLKNLVRFFEGIIADEGLLLDLCVDRAVGIVQFNYTKRAFGSDLLSDQQPTTLHFVGMSTPLAIELYKQVLASIKDRQDEYTKLLEQAQEEMKRGGGKASPILMP